MNRQQQENRNLSESDCFRIVTLREEGYTQVELAERFNVTQSTILRVLIRFSVTGSNSKRPGQGRRTVTTPNQDRFLALRTLRQRFITSTSLQNEFLNRYNFRISQYTIRRRLSKTDLHPGRAPIGPLLTRDHRRQRLHFAHEHVDWNNDDWGRILFTP
ncbi:uncharacterized protein [Diabrotica undecimpunctata]|uniref:uncharacterized protein n=1 Tax=Diabrotica undecimpunctata TaxID=50387 RepID=UPI003B632CA1